MSSSEEEEEELDDNTEINIMDSGEDEATPTKPGHAHNEDSFQDNDDSMMSAGKNEIEEDSNASFGATAGVPAVAAAPEPPQFAAKTHMFESFMSTDPTATTMSEGRTFFL